MRLDVTVDASRHLVTFRLNPIEHLANNRLQQIAIRTSPAIDQS
jgi:hypothetical protein